MAKAAHIQVSAAVIVNADGEILLTRRDKNKHQGGLWEFPGGKQEPDESAEQALARELKEELDIEISAFRPFIRLFHSYPDLDVSLNVYRVLAWEGETKSNEGQPLEWVAASDLANYSFPAANQAIVSACRLSACCAISPSGLEDQSSLLDWADKAINRGAGSLLIRLPDWTQDDLASALKILRNNTQGSAVSLLLSSRNYSAGLAEWLDGVQLTGESMNAMQSRKEYAGHLLLGASCHDLSQIEQAQKLGLDYLFLSPVQATSSHPDIVPLGWDTFETWASSSNMPVYALGGVGLEHLSEAWSHWAQGIAAISAFR